MACHHTELPHIPLPAAAHLVLHLTPIPVFSLSSCWWKMEIEMELSISKVGGQPQCVGPEGYHRGVLLNGEERAEREGGTAPPQSHPH